MSYNRTNDLEGILKGYIYFPIVPVFRWVVRLYYIFTIHLVYLQDGSQIIASNWNEEEPNDIKRNGENEDCLMALADGKWNDDHCNRRLDAICQGSKSFLGFPFTSSLVFVLTFSIHPLIIMNTFQFPGSYQGEQCNILRQKLLPGTIFGTSACHEMGNPFGTWRPIITWKDHNS